MSYIYTAFKNINRPALIGIYFFVPVLILVDIYLLSGITKNDVYDPLQYSVSDATLLSAIAISLLFMGLLRWFNLLQINKFEIFNMLFLLTVLSFGIFQFTFEIGAYWGLFLTLGLLVVFRYGKLGVYAFTLYLALFTTLYIEYADYLHYYISNAVAFPIVSMTILMIAQIFNRSIQAYYETSITAQEKAVDEHNRTLSFVNSMSDSIISTDTDLNIKVYNYGFLELLDTNKIAEGSNLDHLLNLVNQYGDEINLLDRLQHVTGKYEVEDLLLVVSEDEKMNLYIQATPIIDNENRQTGYTILLRDITKQKSLEQEKDEFISVVSHELRTPITVAEGGVSNLKVIAERQLAETPTRDSLLSMIDTAHNEIINLSRMINDLSTLSRAERNISEGEVEDVSSVEMLKTAHDYHKKQAAAKDLFLKIADDPDITLRTNSLYLSEILQNFISNAIKYTQSGGVTIGAVALDERYIEFYVQDTGIGISKSDQKKIFEKFFRSEDYRTRESSGTGLGLYVTKKLCSMIGADVSVKSKLNEGTRMSIVMPREFEQPNS